MLAVFVLMILVGLFTFVGLLFVGLFYFVLVDYSREDTVQTFLGLCKQCGEDLVPDAMLEEICSSASRWAKVETHSVSLGSC